MVKNANQISGITINVDVKEKIHKKNVSKNGYTSNSSTCLLKIENI